MRRDFAALGLDIGSSFIKCAFLDRGGNLFRKKIRPSPREYRKKLICDSSAQEYLNAATDLLKSVLKYAPKTVPIGLSAQRSSFLLWEKSSGNPVTQMISWQDRRADPWCQKRIQKNAWIVSKTGLRLSPHYAGPKLAYLLGGNPVLRRRAARGEILFGTLETYLLWHWTEGRAHETDLSMAARTLLVDIKQQTWSGALLEYCGVPPEILPSIKPTWGRHIPLKYGGILTATAADQAASLMCYAKKFPDVVTVNLGTGGFVMKPMRHRITRHGYLLGPVLSDGEKSRFWALEGTINGIAIALDRFPKEKIKLSDTPPWPYTFCMPDASGIGAPHWIADTGFIFSRGQKSRRVLLEGILFRIYEILEDIASKSKSEKLFLSGGLSQDRFIRKGLACLWGRSIYSVKEKETTLLGIARLAGGVRNAPLPTCERIDPPSKACTLKAKYREWKCWVRKVFY